jgi:spermidine/putrescine transport system ATP-binding protein
LKQIQTEVGITFIYVTHDQEEAMTMSDRIAVMNDGRLQQVGSPRQVYEHPHNRFVADFIGETNFIDGIVTALGAYPTVELPGQVPVMGDGDGREFYVGEPVTLALRPERINIYPQGRVDVVKAEVGMRAKQVADILGGSLPDRVDMKEWLLAEPNNVVVEGTIEETNYIGTDTRYRVVLHGGTELFVRQQNYGTRYDEPLDEGKPVFLQWTPENAQILLD